MYCQSLNECFNQISTYAGGSCTGFPLLVNVNNFADFNEIAQRLYADDSKQCIYVSEHTFGNGMPDIETVKALMSQPGNYAVIGISQSMMLKGKQSIDEILDELTGMTVRGHAVVLLSHCRVMLEKYCKRDVRLEKRIVFLEGESSILPQLRIAKSKEECVGSAYDNGMRELLSHLERITDNEIESHPVIRFIAPFSKAVFKNSLFAVNECGGVYEVLIEKYKDILAATEKGYGTDDQWGWLLSEMKKSKSFSDYVVSVFDSTTNLAGNIGDVFESGSNNTKWLLWIAMKVFGSGSNKYLSLALSNSDKYDDFEKHIYQDLLDIDIKDSLFEKYFFERKQLLERLPENLPEVSSYCANVGRHGKDAVYYLTDATENEEYTFMQLLDHYEWDEAELTKAVEHGFPELALYMREFVFDKLNTKLPEKDAPFREVLTDYFKRYKIQKITNHIEDDFLDEVNAIAVERPFYKLMPRSGIVSAMNKNNVQAYFFDALGVEFLSYIQAKCDTYGLIYEISIGHCELPSITVKNKDFKHYFETKDIGDLDELKHHSQIYDYRKCEYPIHIFKELNIIDGELRRIRAQLIQNNTEKAVILSDHGASRLAVIYKHENSSPLELDENGEHSGRCCPVMEDPGIPQAAYEDGYAILCNYERFKGGRKANLEVHGGASLEEVIVPVITIALRPDDVEYYFVNPVVKYKMGQPSKIELFCNVPMKKPRIEVEGIFYDGAFSADSKHAVFELTEQKRVREYKATVYEGNTNTGVVLTFRIERNTKTKNLFDF